MKQAEIKKQLLWELDEEIDHMLDALFRDNSRWFAWEQGRVSGLSGTLERCFGNEEGFVIKEVKRKLPAFCKEYKKNITFKDYQEYSLAWVIDFVN